jgi:tetratricopeptide (TPR) repeat protein
MEICKKVLSALTSTAEYPLGYAFILHNLGSACKLYSKIRNRDSYLDKAIHYFKMILDIDSIPPTSEIVASTHLNLGAIHNIIASIRDRNQHLAEAAAQFKKALRIYDTRQNTLRRSITQINLGQTYLALAENDNEGENYQKAAAAFEEAVQLLDPRVNKIQFIESSIFLGKARLRSAQCCFEEEMVERGIKDYTAALQVCSQEEMPVEYANIQMGLGEAYQFLGLAKRQADCFGKAIAALEAALKAVAAKKLSAKEAEVMKKLGFAYCDFAKLISKETNLQKAENYYRNAQRIMDLDRHPLEFAELNEALAETYVERGEINKREHYLNLAIKTLEETEPILAVVGSPEQSSRLQSRLGDLYRTLAETIEEIGAKKEAYRKSIAGYERVLQYFTIDKFPKEFADNTLEIGITYKTMAETIKNRYFNSIAEYNEFRADRLLNAMGAFEGALRVFTIDQYPYDFALVQFYMGESYAMLAELQEEKENLTRALAAIADSLKVFKPKEYPVEHKKALYYYEKVKRRM